MKNIKVHGKIIFWLGLVVGLGLTTRSVYSDDKVRPQTLIEAEKAIEKGDYGTAIRYCTKTIETTSEADEAFYFRGLAYVSVGRPTRAVADFSRSLKLNPGQWDAHYNRGIAYEERGDYAKAVVDYEQAISLGPLTQSGTVEVYNDLAWLLATCEMGEGISGDSQSL